MLWLWLWTVFCLSIIGICSPILRIIKRIRRIHTHCLLKCPFFFFFFFLASPINRIVLVSCFDIVFFLLTFSFDFYNYNLKFKVSSPDAFPPLLLLHSTLFFSFFFTVNLLGIISQDHNHPSTTDNPPPKDKTRQNKGKERLFSALYTIIRTSILHVYQFLWIFLYHQMNV